MKHPFRPVTTFETFHRLAQAELPEWHRVAEATQAIRLKKGQPLFTAGQKKPFAYVLNHGVIKLVYETKRGDYWVNGFLLPGTCFASLTALKEGGTTSLSAYAVHDSSVDQVDFQTLDAMTNEHMAWMRGLGALMRHYARAKELREMELLTLSPQDRYLKFLDEYGRLAPHLTQVDIASYVRVTPVALSRIKKRLLGENRLPPALVDSMAA